MVFIIPQKFSLYAPLLEQFLFPCTSWPSGHLFWRCTHLWKIWPPMDKNILEYVPPTPTHCLSTGKIILKIINELIKSFSPALFSGIHNINFLALKSCDERPSFLSLRNWVTSNKLLNSNILSSPCEMNTVMFILLRRQFWRKGE